MIAVTREGWIIFGFIALGIAALAVAVAGVVLFLRDHRHRRSERNGRRAIAAPHLEEEPESPPA